MIAFQTMPQNPLSAVPLSPPGRLKSPVRSAPSRFAHSVEVQGHRGLGDEAPHNSLAAFREAAKHPYVRSVEFDVRRSADGYLIVTHGPELLTAGKPLEKVTLHELQKLDIGGGEHVPLLADVIDLCLQGGLLMNVEIKAEEKMDIVADTLDLLRKKGAFASTRISSFDRKMLEEVMKLEPLVPIGALYNGATGYVDPTDQSKGLVFAEAPADFASWDAGRRHVDGDSVNLRAEAVLRHPELVAQGHRHGKQVLAWFPGVANAGFEDGRQSYQRLVEIGVDVICANNPSLLGQMLLGS